ncbi:MAG: hypothetical protein KDC53_23100, partial [Saprospiraceae bacterium]|nr:hypothetical protein [Saprospiraceae bacterium]
MNQLLTLFLILYWISNVAQAQPYTELGSQMVVNYTPKEYGAYGQNWMVAQNNCGIMYFGNWGGLLEFDGTFWTLYELPNKSSVNSLCIVEDGKIYAGGTNELGYFFADSLGKFVFHSLVDELPEEKHHFSSVWQTFSEEGKIYFCTHNHVFIWSEMTQTFQSFESDAGFHSMLKVGKDFYIRTIGRGLSVIKNDSLYLLPGSEKFANEKIFSMLPLPGEDASLIVTRSMGLYKYKQGIFHSIQSEVYDFIAENLNYASGTVLSDGNILLGTLRGGAVVIDTAGRMVRKYNVDNGIINNNIYHTMQDCSGAIWLATDNGISHIDYASPVEVFDQRNKFDAIPLNIVRYSGIIYVASTTGAYLMNPQSSAFQHLNHIDKQSWSFLEAANNLIIASSDGLFEIKKSELSKPWKIPENIYSPTVLSSSESNREKLYVGAADGVFILSKNKNQWYTENQILDNLDQKSSVVEDNGVVWVGTIASGLFKINLRKDPIGGLQNENPVVDHYTHINGLQDGPISVVRIDEEIYFFSLDSI